MKLKYCFFCISDTEAPYLYELMTELSEEDVKLFTLEPGAEFPKEPIPKESYTITDNETGTDFARFHDTGYVFYSPEGSAVSTDTSDAQCIIEGFDEITADFIDKMYRRKHGIPWTIAETDRTLIRELCTDDIDDLFSLYEDREIRRFIPPLLPTKKEELAFQKAYIEKMYGFFGYGFWNVYDKESGKLIGRAGLSNRPGFDHPELGYLIAEEYRNQGIATEVCTAVIDYARFVLGAEKLFAFIQKENLPSIHLSENLGFKDTGETVKGHNDQELLVFTSNLIV